MLSMTKLDLPVDEELSNALGPCVSIKKAR
jgi:hypothetical protein